MTFTLVTLKQNLTLTLLLSAVFLIGCQSTATPTPTNPAIEPTTAATTPAESITPTLPPPTTTPADTPAATLPATPTTAPSPTAQSSPLTPQSSELTPQSSVLTPQSYTLEEYPVPAGSHPHDVAPAPDGGVWYTAQRSGELGYLDPTTGQTHHIPLGPGSAPHGVIVGPDGAPWITDGGLNAIVRVDPTTEAVQTYPLPANRSNANLNTAAFDGRGILWFTGQNGIYGRLDPATGQMEVFDAPRGRGPYGIDATPAGDIYYVSLAGRYLAQLNLDTGEATILDPPTPGQGARRVWSDSNGRLWISEWNAGQVGMYDPASGEWREWRLPGNNPMAYAVYVDDRDQVWLTDFGANAIVRFDPTLETFESFPLPSPSAQVRQLLGRPGELWGAESGTDKLVVIRSQ